MSENPGLYEAFETRAPDEEHWASREELFNSYGYKFRPRLRKDWVPSWRATGGDPLICEDGEISQTHLIDAYTDNGKFVCIKRVERNGKESQIAQMLSTKALRADPRNHCVPIIEVIDDPDDDTLSYIVMPLLRDVEDPPFQYVKEIVDFVDQILEGLVFMHENGVAHRDCVMHNILMDADAMYPEGFHPVRVSYKRDYSGRATYLPRSVAGVRYYFVDFGISSYIPEEEPQKFVTGFLGRDRDPPELSQSSSYDPFKLDIFIIGNMLKQKFCDKFTNIDFLLPLIQQLTMVDPEQRPTARKALKDWLAIRDKISTVKREWRTRPRGEDVWEAAAQDGTSLLDVSMYFAMLFVERFCRW